LGLLQKVDIAADTEIVGSNLQQSESKSLPFPSHSRHPLKLRPVSLASDRGHSEDLHLFHGRQHLLKAYSNLTGSHFDNSASFSLHQRKK